MQRPIITIPILINIIYYSWTEVLHHKTLSPLQIHVNPEQISNNVQNGLSPEVLNIDPQSQLELDEINELNWTGFGWVNKSLKYRDKWTQFSPKNQKYQ